MADFFISYSRNDQHWAEWIAFILENAGYSTLIQAWDFAPGTNFVSTMHRATIECNTTIAVLSPDYLASLFTLSEWAVAFSSDPDGTKRTLIPVRVRSCEPPGLLKTLVYCDLVGLGEQEAEQKLLQGVEQSRSKPETVPFPIAAQDSSPYPGLIAGASLQNAEHLAKEALDLLNIFKTTGATFEAQARVRDKLLRSVCERLLVYPVPGFEEFIARYHGQFDDYERQLFATVRSFTEHVLFEYNSRALSIIQKNPNLKTSCPTLDQMEMHLTVWLSKYHGVFLKNPHMGLVYVGVDEAVPFPNEAVSELWNYLREQEGTNDLLSLEPHPMDHSEETSPPGREGDWRQILQLRWNLKRLGELEADERKIAGQASIANLTAVTKGDFCRVNHEYAELIIRTPTVQYRSVSDKTFNGEDKLKIWNQLAKPFAELLNLDDVTRFEQFDKDENFRWSYLDKIGALHEDPDKAVIWHSLNRMLVGLWISSGVSREEFIKVLLDLICNANIPDQVDDFYQAWVTLRSIIKRDLEKMIDQ